MKRLAVMLAAFIFLFPLKVGAEDQPELLKMRATAYIGPSEHTCTGKRVHPGIAGAKREWLGMTAIVYQRLPGDKVGEVSGIYEIEDTGDTEGVNNGYVIDIWNPTLDDCQLFMNRVYEDGCQGKVYVQLLEANG